MPKKDKVYCKDCVHRIGDKRSAQCKVGFDTSVEENFFEQIEVKIYAKCADRNRNNKCKDWERA